MMIPTVSMATLKTCTGVYRFPQMYPTNMVVTLPPLRRIMWTGTEMLYPKAKLFRRLTVKKRTMLGSHRASGMARGFKKKGGLVAEK